MNIDMNDSTNGLILASHIKTMWKDMTRESKLYAISTLLYELNSIDEVNDVNPTSYEIILEEMDV
jgi:hypothetical protein